jgi:hypothetical protein
MPMEDNILRKAYLLKGQLHRSGNTPKEREKVFFVGI